MYAYAQQLPLSVSRNTIVILIYFRTSQTRARALTFRNQTDALLHGEGRRSNRFTFPLLTPRFVGELQQLPLRLFSSPLRAAADQIIYHNRSVCSLLSSSSSSSSEEKERGTREREKRSERCHFLVLIDALLTSEDMALFRFASLNSIFTRSYETHGRRAT